MLFYSAFHLLFSYFDILIDIACTCLRSSPQPKACFFSIRQVKLHNLSMTFSDNIGIVIFQIKLFEIESPILADALRAHAFFKMVCEILISVIGNCRHRFETKLHQSGN